MGGHMPTTADASRRTSTNTAIVSADTAVGVGSRRCAATPAQRSRRSLANQTGAVTSTKAFSRQDQQHTPSTEDDKKNWLEKHKNMEDNYKNTDARTYTHTYTHYGT